MDTLITDKETIILSTRTLQSPIVGALIDNGWIWRDKRTKRFMNHGRHVRLVSFEQGMRSVEGFHVDHIILIGDVPDDEWFQMSLFHADEVTHVDLKEFANESR